MVTPRHLNKAPITEALVDVRVKLRPDIDLSTLQSVADSASGDYPEKKERIRVDSKFEFKTKQSKTTFDVDGYLCTSSDQKQVVQFRLDGFTFSRLRPYKTWEDLREEAYRLWQLYVRATSPEWVTRVAVRYLNQLEIPLLRELSDYLTSPPTIPRDLPQVLNGFLMRYVIRDPSSDMVGIVMQSFEPVKAPDMAPVVLDIDVFKEVQYNVDAKTTWETLDQLRGFKNRIFFESITEKIVELYK